MPATTVDGPIGLLEPIHQILRNNSVFNVLTACGSDQKAINSTARSAATTQDNVIKTEEADAYDMNK